MDENLLKNDNEFASEFRNKYKQCEKSPWKILILLKQAKKHGNIENVPDDILKEAESIIYSNGNYIDQNDFNRILASADEDIIVRTETDKLYDSTYEYSVSLTQEYVKDESEYSIAIREFYNESVKAPWVMLVLLNNAKKRGKLDEVPRDILNNIAEIIYTEGNDIDKNDLNNILSPSIEKTYIIH